MKLSEYMSNYPYMEPSFSDAMSEVKWLIKQGDKYSITQRGDDQIVRKGDSVLVRHNATIHEEE